MRVVGAFCAICLCMQLYGCLWGTAAVVGVAVVGANVEEIREAGRPRNATQDIDEHLEHQRRVEEALEGASGEQDLSIDTDQIIDEYGGRILTD